MNYHSYSHEVVLGLLLLIALTGLSTIATGSVTAQQVDIAASDLDGEGTIESPYVITNVSELQSMEDDLDAHYKLGSDIDASKTDTWNDGKGFNPIGDVPTGENGFTGSLNGSGHKISNLVIHRPNEDYVALFGGTVPSAYSNSTTGFITRLAVSEVDITGNNYVGGIVGSNWGRIGQSYAVGTVSGNNTVGGLTGENNGEFGGGIIAASYVSVAVDGNNTVGGLSGDTWNGAPDPQSSFWDVDISGQQTSDGGTGLTTEEMTGIAAESNMSGLDFATVWETQSNDYPVFSSQTSGDNTDFTPINITLAEPDTATHGSGGAKSQVPEIKPNRSIKFANGTNYQFIITDEDNGGTVTTTPPVNTTTDTRIILNNPDPDGSVDGRYAFWIPGVTDGVIDAPVTTTGQVATQGVVNLSVSIDGESSDQTQTQPYVLGYVSNYTQNSTSEEIQVSVNQSVLPRRTSLTATIYNATVDFPADTSDFTSTTLNYSEVNESFIGSFSADAVHGGNYSIKVEGTLPSPYETQFERYGMSKITVEQNDEGGGDSSGSGFVDVGPADLAGNGTDVNPYVITNVSELQAMEDDLDAHYTLDNDIDASGTAQWNDGSGFDPIGGNPFDDNTAPAFNGSLDGDNHKITELTISRSNENQVGLFGVIQSATITQLSLVNATVDGSKRVGALVGKDGYQSNIKNILISGSISGSDSTGGLIGQTYVGTVQYTEASVTVSGGLSTGGLVGKSLSSEAAGQGTIKNATVTGTVTGDDVAGGLIGRNSALIQAAAASVDVEATGGTAGGLVGDNFATIQNVKTSGNITGEPFKSGGLAGINIGTIQDADASGNVKGSTSVGGLVGDNRGTIQNVVATGDVNGTDRVGGLVGASSLAEDPNTTIEIAAAAGNVTGSSSVGGLIGTTGENITIENTVAAGDIDGSDSVGGLIGENGGTIRKSFAVGSVNGDSGVGGVTGSRLTTGQVNESYWDEQTTGETSSAGNATGLTTAEMTGQAAETNMTGLEFGTVWETQPNDYPFLLSFISDEDSDSGILIVENLTVPDSISQGENISISATINNTDNNSLTQNITFSYSYTAGNVGGGASNSTSITVAGESTEQVSTQLTVPTDADSLTIEIASEDDSLSTTLNVNQSGDTAYVDVDPSDLAGSGTQADPYVITNVSELQAMEDSLNANYTLGNDINASVTEQFNNGSGFNPIGTAEYGTTNQEFTGSLDGNDQNVTGLTINRSGEGYTGLFGSIDSATIENISLMRVIVIGDFETGGLVGEARGTSTMQNVSVSGTVNGTYDIGGIVGAAEGSTTVQNAVASVDVSDDGGDSSAGGLVGGVEDNSVIQNVSASGNISGGGAVGGLVGRNRATIKDAKAAGRITEVDRYGSGQGGLVGRNGGTVQNSSASGSVISPKSNAVGGLIGQNRGNVTNVTASGIVNASSNVGGLVGANGVRQFTATIKNAKASGRVTGDTNAGGLVGRNNNAGMIQNAESYGDITGEESIGGLVGSNNGTVQTVAVSDSVVIGIQVGGLIGFNDEAGTVHNATTLSSVTSTAESFGDAGGLIGVNYGAVRKSSASGNVAGNNTVGGLIADNTGTIQNTTATGDVNGSEGVGGLVGANRGSITISYATGNVEGNSSVGGLVGRNRAGPNGNKPIVNNTYATGSVAGNTSVGGLVGENDNAIVESSYWDEQSTGQSTSAGNATGLTTAEMTGQAAETNMDELAFGTAWKTQPDDYPVLAQQTIDNGNTAPIARFSYSPDTPTGGTTVSFDATDSTDSDGSITTYEWDFDEDGLAEASGQTVNQTFGGGEYTVTLIITDDDGRTDTSRQVVNVSSSGGSSILENTVSLSGSTVTVNTTGVNAIAVENLPPNATISNVSSNGEFNSDERSILYYNLSDDGLPANVTFNLDPDDGVYTTNDTITFSVDRTQVSLEVTTVPKELQGDVTSDQYAAVTNETNVLTAGSLSESINGWADNGKTNGVEIGALELSRLINYWSDT